ncbi:MAG TPA: hypothetical protein PLS63_04370 [Microthrixaceae bacterium]|nr:hypothetical protein [Microthrixaceae bacterium]
MKVAFLVPSLRLSGGLNVVMEHGSRLARDHGFDITMIVTHHQGEAPWPYPGLGDVTVADLDDVADEPFDLAIATWWDTVARLARVSAKRVAYFVQSIEDRFYDPLDPQAALASLTYRLGLPVVTEATWMAELFRASQPDVACHYVRNGVNKDIFPEQVEVEPRRDGPLRVLIEGNVDDRIKGVPEAFEAIQRMSEPVEVTLVSAKGGSLPGASIVGPLDQRELSTLMSETDVVLKLSRIEGMSGPPLEAFHRGATCVVTPMTGHDEYVQHGWNGLVTGWDDPIGTARQLDLLARDRRLLHFLRTNAAATARAWPGWDQAATMMAGALGSIAAGPAVEFATLAPILSEARFRISRDARVLHGFKVKTQADAAHIAKLDQLVADTAASAHEARTELAAAQHLAHERDEALARLRTAADALDRLDGSRWLRLLSVFERPIRRRRPGLGSVQSRIAAIRDDVDAGI